MSDKCEWVEILEPRTQENVYANLSTGECLWSPPPGAKIKKSADNGQQWWELFDPNTSRNYYYNALLQKTVWHRPTDCQIISFAKLQTMTNNSQICCNLSDNISCDSPIFQRESSTQTSIKKDSSALMRSSLRGHQNLTTNNQISQTTRHLGRKVERPTVPFQSSTKSAFRRPGLLNEPSWVNNGNDVESSSPHHYNETSLCPRSTSIDQYLKDAASNTGLKTDVHLNDDCTDESLLEPEYVNARSTADLRFKDTKQGALKEQHKSVHRFIERKDSRLAEKPRGFQRQTQNQTSNFQRQDSCPPGNRTSEISLSSDGRHLASPGFAQQLQDVSQITTVQVTPRPKPRAFPRTNPTFAGTRKRGEAPTNFMHGSSNISTGVFNKTFVDSSLYGSLQPNQPGSQTLQMSRSYLADSQSPRTNFPSNGCYSDEEEDEASEYGQDRLSEISNNGLDNVDKRTQLQAYGEKKHITSIPTGVMTLQRRMTEIKHTNNSYINKHHDLKSVHSAAYRPMSHQSKDIKTNNFIPSRQIDQAKSNKIGQGLDTRKITERNQTRRNSEPDYVNVTNKSDPESQSHHTEKNAIGLNGKSNIVFSRKNANYQFQDKQLRRDSNGNRRNDSTQINNQDNILKIAETPDLSNSKKLMDRKPRPARRPNNLNKYEAHDDDEKIWQMQEPYEHVESQEKLEKRKIWDRKFASFDQDYEHNIDINNGYAMELMKRNESERTLKLGDQGEEELVEGVDYMNNDEIIKGINHNTSRDGEDLKSNESSVDGTENHLSLRRHRWGDKNSTTGSGQRQTTNEKCLSLQAELAAHHRPLSMVMTSAMESNSIVIQVADSLIQQMDIEKFLSENLNEHRKGLLGKTVPVGNMLSWTKDVIQKPMIRTENRIVKKEAPEVFKLIQVYMGERKGRESGSCSACAPVHELITKAWSCPELRDEIYIQLCRQTTRNPKDSCLLLGWELMALCLAFLPPSQKFHSYLEGFILKTLESRDPTEDCQMHKYANACCRRLDRISQSGTKHKPSLEEIEHSKKTLVQPSMFGSTLDVILDLQKDRLGDARLPWIQTTLSQELLKLTDQLTEGIFRVPGDTDEVNALKTRVDAWQLPPSDTDPHILASLLKLWYRELQEPLVPALLYDECVSSCTDADLAVTALHKIPEPNQTVFCYLIRFLQKFSQPDISSITKMDASNLSMVMAPNVLRCDVADAQLMLENARKEMSFLRLLVQHLDTSHIHELP